MVYQNNLVVAIKVGGKVLRENKDAVALPFGSEYSVLVKNLSAVRAAVRVSIDGTDTTSGGWIIVPANDSVELERFIRDGNWESGNRFKFIERTSEIEQHRGIRAEDGLVRVEYKFEQLTTYYPYYPWVYDYRWPYDYWRRHAWSVPYWPFNSLGTSADWGFRSANPSTDGSVLTNHASSNAGATANIESAIGITVPGGRSDQRFVGGAWFPTESISHVIVLRLLGAVDGKEFKQPITVDQKPNCMTCGKSNRPTDDFCGRCGTALRLF